jgi:hypothetical protein
VIVVYRCTTCYSAATDGADTTLGSEQSMELSSCDAVNALAFPVAVTFVLGLFSPVLAGTALTVDSTFPLSKVPV